MDALRKGDRDVHFGFENQMPGSIPHGPVVDGNIYVEATKYISPEDKEQKLAIFLEGLDLFEMLFGYRSETVIPPNLIWSPDYNEAVLKKGVRFFQGYHKMCEPVTEGKYKYHTFFQGQKNKYGQIHLIRNVLFEPSLYRLEINDPIDQCLSDMDIAFRMNKPAVISSHRVNYVGFIDKNNRDRTLKLFNKLLKTALKRWPEIEFMKSNKLGQIISNHDNNKKIFN
jgi:hypothetical protein